MKKRTQALAGSSLIALLVLGTSLPAYAYQAGGTRYCPTGRTMTLGSQTGSGYVYHRHTSLNNGLTYTKDWTNSGTTWRYSSGGYEDVSWLIKTASAQISSYTTGCYV